MKTQIAVAIALGALALSPGWAAAEEETHSLEQLVVEMASTPAEHAALANHYRAKAAAAQAEAQDHNFMGRSYGGGKLAQRQVMQEHCRKLSEQNTAMAQEYESLAKLHEEAANPTE